uniref:Uncharacterized protein n=1 Tax=Coccidioides posadasii RMSCC 3488 TaxID=454284 RepID=A0A0J6FUA4_COCPO|nr:hypothetical protein CPAG_08983 [Coccidioides posadasii RMSCC 3488]
MAQTGMETVSARLASFKTAHRPISKGRTSGAKTKPITWPHVKPSPEELADAGFYYQPTEISPDNTACFLCRYALDGWEEDDDPITEHLRHSRECGWAIIMDITRRSSNPAEIVDPTSPEIAEARRATFGTWWPHDGKKGWKCKTEKMVEAGWYLCATEESDDFVSCAYCNLSLDGWEPKDDPFDEHYRRSSECSFFHFAPIQGKKGRTGRGKNTRSSKASRSSTQSTLSTFSEAETADLDSEMEQSLLSQSAKETSKRSSRAGAKGKKIKAKVNEAVVAGSRVEDDATMVESQQPKKPRGRKRKSSEMIDNEGFQETSNSDVRPEPATKKRATGTRKTSTAKTRAISDLTDDELNGPIEPVKSEKRSNKKLTKKRSTSKNRAQSGASKDPLISRIPNDAEIDAELEADLERDGIDGVEIKSGTGYEHDTPVAPICRVSKRASDTEEIEGYATEPIQKPGRKKAQGKKKTAKINESQPQDDTEMRDEVQHPRIATDACMDLDDDHISPHSLPVDEAVDEVCDDAQSLKKAKPSRKQKRSRSKEEDAREEEASDGLARDSANLRRLRTQSVSEDHIPSERTAPSPVDSTPFQAQERTPSPSPQSSDAENRPPSSRPEAFFYTVRTEHASYIGTKNI